MLVQSIVRSMSSVLSCPLTVKMRIGYDNDKPTAHNIYIYIYIHAHIHIHIHIVIPDPQV